MSVFSFQFYDAQAYVFAHMDLIAALRIVLLRAKDNVLTVQDHGAADVYTHAKVRWVLICVRALSHSFA